MKNGISAVIRESCEGKISMVTYVPRFFLSFSGRKRKLTSNSFDYNINEFINSHAAPQFIFFMLVFNMYNKIIIDIGEIIEELIADPYHTYKTEINLSKLYITY